MLSVSTLILHTLAYQLMDFYDRQRERIARSPLIILFGVNLLFTLITDSLGADQLLFHADFETDAMVNDPRLWKTDNLSSTKWVISDFPGGGKGLQQTAEGCLVSGNTPLPTPIQFSDGIIQLEMSWADNDSWGIIFRQSASDQGYLVTFGYTATPYVIVALLDEGCGQRRRCLSDSVDTGTTPVGPCENNPQKTLAQVPHGLFPTNHQATHDLSLSYLGRVEARGDTIRVWLLLKHEVEDPLATDIGPPLVEVQDSTHQKGRIGVWHESQWNSMIDNVYVWGELNTLELGLGDDHLQVKLEQVLGLKSNAPNFLEALSQLTRLMADDSQISDISALQYCSQLTELSLNQNHISDLSPLLENEKIGGRIELKGNRLSNHALTVQIPQLQQRGVEIIYDQPESEIVHFSSNDLERIVRQSLRKSENEYITIADLNKVQNPLFGLRVNTWSELAPISHMTQLKGLVLYLEERTPLDLSVLSNLSSLQRLEIIGYFPYPSNEHLDLNPLSNLVLLTELNLSYLRISDLSPLSNLSDLQTLEIIRPRDNGRILLDLSPLSNLSQLITLHINSWGDYRNYQISDLSPLANLGQLTNLSIGGDTISDLSPLANLGQLTNLSIHGDAISDLSPLDSRLSQLTYFYLSGNLVGGRSVNGDINYSHKRTKVYIDGQELPQVGDLLQAEVHITNGVSITGFDFNLDYDQTSLQLIDIKLGDYLPPATASSTVTTDVGSVTFAGQSANQHPSSGDGVLSTITFKVLAYKTSTLALSVVNLQDSFHQNRIKGRDATARLWIPSARKPEVVAFWPFNGNYQDLSRRQLDAEGTHTTFTSGRNGQGVYFNGQDAEVSLPVIAPMDEVTIANWLYCKRPDYTNDDRVSVFRTKGGYEKGAFSYQMIVRNPDQLRLIMSSGGSGVLLSSEIIADRWYHVAYTHSVLRGQTKLYLNGELVAENQDTSISPLIIHSALMGVRNTGMQTHQHFKGIIDEFVVINGVISSEEIQQLMTSSSRMSKYLPWSAAITITSENGKVKPRQLQFGTVNQASAEFDAGIDLVSPPSPQEPVFLDAYLTSSDSLIPRLAADHRAPAEAVTFTFQVRADQNPFTLNWNKAKFPHLFAGIRLKQSWPLSSKSYNMKALNQVTFPSLAGQYYTFEIDLSPSALIQLAPGWNMISIPGIPQQKDPKILFGDHPDLVLPLYHWDPEHYTYQPVQELKFGQGYWALTTKAEGTMLQVPHTPVTHYSRSISPGWNMIGSPATVVDFSRAEEDPDNSILDASTFSWNADYFAYDQVEQLEPGKGYWILALNGCELTVRGGNLLATPTKLIDMADVQVDIRLHTVDQEQNLSIGWDAKASPELDRFDRFQPPSSPMGKGQQAYLYRPNLNHGLHTDIQPAAKEIEWTLISQNQEPIYLSVERRQVPPDYQLLLLASGQRHNLMVSPTIMLPEQKVRLRLDYLMRLNKHPEKLVLEG